MSRIVVFTNRDLKGQNPLFPSSDFHEDFLLLNMYPDGIWLVDKYFPKFTEIKQMAIDIVVMFGDAETIKKLKDFTV